MEVEIYTTREAVPEPPPDCPHVVVDAYRFSTSVLTLLEGGASRVRPATTLEEVRAYADREGWLAGGEPGDDEAEFRISNSPTRIDATDVEGRSVCLHSINGAQAVGALADREVYLGTTLNAEAVAAAVADTADRAAVVAVGSGGEPAVEDLIAASLIGRHLRGELAAFERTVFEAAVAGANLTAGRRYPDSADAVLLADVDTATVVPRLVEGAFVDAGDGEPYGF